jgi:hypothetical protein
MTGGRGGLKGEKWIMTRAEKPPGAGHGSFDLIDRGRFFDDLRLKESMILLDLGWGRGD